MLQIGYKNCDDRIQQFENGKLALKPGCNAEETLESYINGELSKMREEAGKILIK